MKKNCINCGISYNASSRQKYCSAKCKSHFNYLKSRNAEHHVQIIDNILHENRQILNRVLKGNNYTIIFKSNLNALKFYPTCITSYEKKDNKVFYYCYEFEFSEVDSERWMIVKKSREIIESKILVNK